MQRSSVDLPDPEAPITQTTPCSAHLEVDALEHQVVAEGLADAVELERRHRILRCSRATSESVKRASGIVRRMKRSAVARYGV